MFTNIDAEMPEMPEMLEMPGGLPENSQLPAMPRAPGMPLYETEFDIPGVPGGPDIESGAPVLEPEKSHEVPAFESRLIFASKF